MKAPNSDPNDEFGRSASVSGDTIAVGSPFEDSTEINITNGSAASLDNSKSNSGAAYVFKRN